MKIGKQVIVTIVVALALWMMSINPYIAFWGLSVYLMFLSNAASFCDDFNMSRIVPFAGASIVVVLITLALVPSAGVVPTLAAVLLQGMSVVVFVVVEMYERYKIAYIASSIAYYVTMLYLLYLVYV